MKSRRLKDLTGMKVRDVVECLRDVDPEAECYIRDTSEESFDVARGVVNEIVIQQEGKVQQVAIGCYYKQRTSIIIADTMEVLGQDVCVVHQIPFSGDVLETLGNLTPEAEREVEAYFTERIGGGWQDKEKNIWGDGQGKEHRLDTHDDDGHPLNEDEEE